MIEDIKDAIEIAVEETKCGVSSKGFDMNGCAYLRHEFFYYIKYYQRYQLLTSTFNNNWAFYADNDKCVWSSLTKDFWGEGGEPYPFKQESY